MPEGVVAIEPPKIPESVLVHLGNVRGALETALFSGVVGGSRPEGVSTASGLAILSGQARLKFGPPLRMLQTSVARLLWRTGLLLERAAEQFDIEEFEIAGRSVRVADFSDDFQCQVRLMTEDPEEERLKQTNGLSWWGKLDNRYVAETYLGIENWAEREEEMLYQGIISSQEFQAALGRFISLPQVQQGGQPGQPGQQAGAQPGQGGVGALLAAAQAGRALSPGGLPQQRPLPRSPEEAASIGVAQRGLPPQFGPQGGGQ
jgi:hypothetical protein